MWRLAKWMDVLRTWVKRFRGIPTKVKLGTEDAGGPIGTVCSGRELSKDEGKTEYEEKLFNAKPEVNADKEREETGTEKELCIVKPAVNAEENHYVPVSSKVHCSSIQWDCDSVFSTSAEENVQIFIGSPERKGAAVSCPQRRIYTKQYFPLSRLY
ncbi:uncharacterized protein LOC143773443 isoform X2 [Ranitomeya variabilis]|uniref:uncharacterized protein LOC143773443 isoform X2 n=1 Tax=Ranitomeya variabilis TaxID=490064 RepID=UPI004056A610